MGKNLIQQARGKGGPRYRAPSFRYKGKATHNKFTDKIIKGIVIDIIHCQGHSAPLAEIRYENNEKILMIAPEGIKVGDSVESGGKNINNGNILALKDLPIGTQIYNIESNPGDGGKFVRSSGTCARVIGKIGNEINVELPSKKKKMFNEKCRACIGLIAGGGRTEKPLLRAGTMFFKMKAKNKLWPKVSGSAMNAVDHPFGNARSSRKSKAKPMPRNAPPGRKVGMIAAKRTGRRKKK